jgi:integrase
MKPDGPPRDGVEVRHAQGCRARAGGRCNCEPSYRARVWDQRTGKRLRRTFPNKTAAKNWRTDTLSALRRGKSLEVEDSTITLNAAAEEWLAGARAGSVRSRSGRIFKPSTIRGYERALRLRVLPKIGTRRLSSIRRGDVQRLVDDLLTSGADPHTIRNTLDPLRSIYRRALQREDVTTNATEGLEVPRGGGKRDRIASPQEAAQLLEALSDSERPLWATAIYAGLRRGELRGLLWDEVDLAAGVIRVERGWDDDEGEVAVKSDAGRRRVPIITELRRELRAHKLRTGRDAGQLVFGRTATDPFIPSTVRRHARETWAAAELTPITLHECRHTFASLMIAAGLSAGSVNMKALSTYMGHSSVTVTMDRYGHLLPGSEQESAELLDAFLIRSVGQTGANGSPLHAVDSGS